MNTKLVFAMPGTGKTTWIKKQSEGMNPEDRVGIDFDYHAPRRHVDGVPQAQARLLNTWARAGVKAVTTFPTFMDVDTLDPNLFDVVFILPKEGQVAELVNRTIARDEDKTTFHEQYIKNGEQWRRDWLKWYDRYAKRFKVTLIELEPGQYVSDVMPDLI